MEATFCCRNHGGQSQQISMLWRTLRLFVVVVISLVWCLRPALPTTAQTLLVSSDVTITQQTYLKGIDLRPESAFGQAVAISGNTVAVAAPATNGGEGGVHIFVRSGQTWQQQAYLRATNHESGDFFGWSVALDGNTLVVGAFGEDSNATGINGDSANNAASEAGAAYIFVRTGTTWSQQAYLKASNPDAGDWFGRAVALAGDTVVVGAYGEQSNAIGVNGDGTNNALRYAGAAYVFVRTGATWAQQAYLKASNTEAEDFFGFAVAASGNTVVVGAEEEGSNATGVNGDQTNNAAFDAGAAYVFVRTGTTWAQQAYLKASNTDLVDHFGWSVALDGNTLLVGAPGERSNAVGVNGDQMNNNAPGAGAAYVFVRDGTTWAQQGYLKAANPEFNDNFGYAVALFDNRALVGAKYEDSNVTGIDGDLTNNAATDAGAAYLFTRTGTTWRAGPYLKAPNTDAGDWFGEAVAVGVDTVVIGASAEDSNATYIDGNPANNSALNAGAAYLFTLETKILTVNTTADPGDGLCTGAECTLREALALANTLPGENTITFNIPGPGPHTIQPIGDLPEIVDRVIIDGYTQPGAQPNTNPMTEPINAVILIAIDGSRAQSGFNIGGLTSASANSLIRGLAINRFQRWGIYASHHSVIEGNFIGTDPAGTQALGNGWGVISAGPIGGVRPLIGGTTPAARNLISGNRVGIEVGALSFATVQGNFIGTDATGTKAVGNGLGVVSGAVLGYEPTTITLRGNLISGNETGVNHGYMEGVITGNWFGVDRTGQLPLPNTGDGLVAHSRGLEVGGNVFAYNGGNGIRVTESGGTNEVSIGGNTIFANGAAGIAVIGNRTAASIRQNTIYDNGTLGIDLDADGVTLNDPGDSDSGANQRQNYPELRLVGSDGAASVLYGVINSTPNRTLTLEFFVNQSCDTSGYGEGERFLAAQVMTTDAAGNAAFTVNLPQRIPPDQAVTATATYDVNISGTGDTTSEFARCRAVAGVVNSYLQATTTMTRYDPTPVAGAPAGVFTLRATFVHHADTALTDLFFQVKTLTHNNLLLNAEGAPGGVGAIRAVAGAIPAGAPFTVDFQIGLQLRTPFTFIVDAYGLSAVGNPVATATNATTSFTYTATTEAFHDVIERNNLLYLPLINR